MFAIQKTSRNSQKRDPSHLCAGRTDQSAFAENSGKKIPFSAPEKNSKIWNYSDDEN
jgi:hypothetical protein